MIMNVAKTEQKIIVRAALAIFLGTEVPERQLLQRRRQYPQDLGTLSPSVGEVLAKAAKELSS